MITTDYRYYTYTIQLSMMKLLLQLRLLLRTIQLSMMKTKQLKAQLTNRRTAPRNTAPARHRRRTAAEKRRARAAHLGVGLGVGLGLGSGLGSGLGLG